MGKKIKPKKCDYNTKVRKMDQNILKSGFTTDGFLNAAGLGTWQTGVFLCFQTERTFSKIFFMFT